jgi:hypothetical protein
MMPVLRSVWACSTRGEYLAAPAGQQQKYGMNKALTLALAMALLLPGAAETQGWKMQPVSIPTRWAASVTPSNALPEYPRPQLVRPQWQNLNGLWEYAIGPKDGHAPKQYEGKILVPFPLESALSGVQGALMADQLLWYRRTFVVSAGPCGARTLLHFGAVDFETTVYVNGQEVGTHRGGYEHFSFDITSALKSDHNELVIRVWDPTVSGPNPHGKQGIQHTATSGIWQTVWLERVPQTYIESLRMTPDVDRGMLRIAVNVEDAQPGDALEAIVRTNSTIVARASVSGETAIQIARPRLWSPDDPYLYDLEVHLVRATKVIDRITSYFGLRKIEVKADSAGVPRIFLNNRYTYNLGTLDRGWWPDGIYTAPTDEALKFDIEATKTMGFNTIRKHVKVEPDRWYYHCDKLGILVWQDMVNPARFNPAALTGEARAQFEKELEEVMGQLHNHPSIVTWVLFNERWGPYDQERLAGWIKRLDPSRLLDAHTGPMDYVLGAKWGRQLDPSLPSGFASWSDAASLEAGQRAVSVANWTGGDLTDIHHYPDPRMPPRESGKAQVLGEYGGVGVMIEGHVWDDLDPGYSFLPSSPDQVAKIYAGFVDRLKSFEAQGLSGSIYTNPFDVEGGEYGLMTYDRSVIKIPVAELNRLHSLLVPRARNYAVATRGFSVVNADITPEAQRYAALLGEYQHGRKDPSFLRRVTLMAIRQKDQNRATEIGNEYIARAQWPYSKEVWAFIRTVTRTLKDGGFNILRARPEVADAVLGPNTAEIKIREVITRQEIAPLLADQSSPPLWSELEQRVAAKYGALGREALHGARMMDALSRKDWPEFGRSFAQYFATAYSRSDYPVNALSYTLCRQADDPQELDIATQAMRWNVGFGSGSRGEEKDDPTAFDTYACLLYKSGRQQDARTVQQEAVRLSESRDAQISDNLAKMKAGQPLWDPRAPTASACTNKPGVKFICGPRNAEDLIAVPDSPWIVASGLADSNGLGGALYLIDRRDRSWRTLYPDILPSSPEVMGSIPGSECATPIDPLRFSAHGIHLHADAPRRHTLTLYVVNHGTRESIEIFELDVARDPKARWQGCLILPGKAVANSVVSLPDGGLAVTVMFLSDDSDIKRKVDHGEATGYVLEWHANEGWKQVPGSEGSFPNGIEVSPDGRWLYVTNTGGKNVVRLSRGSEPAQRKAIATDLLTDNLRWDKEGYLWIAGQRGSCSKALVCDALYRILRLDPNTLSLKPIELAPTAPLFGGASVALPLDREVWVGTYRGDRIATFPIHD